MLPCCKHVILLQACYSVASMLFCCKHVFADSIILRLSAPSLYLFSLSFSLLFLLSLVHSSLIYDFFFCMHCKVLMDNYSDILLLFGNHITNYFPFPYPLFTGIQLGILALMWWRWMISALRLIQPTELRVHRPQSVSHHQFTFISVVKKENNS